MPTLVGVFERPSELAESIRSLRGRGFDDLEGKRVNIGNPGSGQRGTMEVVMAAKGWTKDVFSLANELPASSTHESSGPVSLPDFSSGNVKRRTPHAYVCEP